MKRYVALDSWRGICACLVALYHFKANSHFYDAGVMRGAFIFTDFFFVLSGFVITGTYQEKLLNGLSFSRFMKKRFARLWPLHFFMLLCFVLYVVVKDKALGAAPLFSEKEYSLKSFFENLALVQALGVEHTVTWNQPAWSISAEFYTYFLFAVITVFFRSRLWLAELLVVIAVPLALVAAERPNMDFTYDYGLARCLYGFCMGSLSYKLYKNYFARTSWSDDARIMTAAEIAVILFSGAFVACAFPNKFSLLSPYVFLFAILVFAREKGFVSRLLLTKYFVLLGTLSYSIYMVHEFIQLCMYKAAAILEHVSHAPLLKHVMVNGADDSFTGATLLEGDLAYVMMLVLVLPASMFTHRFIENSLKDKKPVPQSSLRSSPASFLGSRTA